MLNTTPKTSMTDKRQRSDLLQAAILDQAAFVAVRLPHLELHQLADPKGIVMLSLILRRLPRPAEPASYEDPLLASTVAFASSQSSSRAGPALEIKSNNEHVERQRVRLPNFSLWRRACAP